MHTIPQTPDTLYHTLCSGPAFVRGDRSEDPRHRQLEDAVEHSLRQREQAKNSAALAQAAADAAELLEAVPTDAVAVSRKQAQQSLRRNNDSESNQTLGSQSRDTKERHAAHAQTFLRDGAAGSGSRYLDDQPATGARQFLDNDEVSACATNTLSPQPQSTGLVANTATSSLAGSDSKQQSKQQRSKQQRSTGKLTVAQLLKRSAQKYVQQYPSQAAPQVQSTLAKLSLCRTEALGGHEYRCRSCEQTVVVPNSCGDRYCPTCSGARRSDWLESTQQLILDGVDHFQVVFTLPQQLSRMSLGNRKAIYNLLFRSSWAALSQAIAEEHGFQAAALMVLHTWNQKLDAHGHVHAVVPACGLSLEDGQLVFAQKGTDTTTRGKYLVDAVALRTLYRKKFLAGLKRLHRRGLLKLEGQWKPLQQADNWQEFLDQLEQAEWVSHITAAPQPGKSSAQQVLKYLARYLGGGPIADSRIVSCGDSTVTFLARSGEQTGGSRQQQPITLTQLEFTRRWCLHILPSGFTRTRRFGYWSNTNREQAVERIAIALEQSDLPLPENALQFGPFDETVDGTADRSVDETVTHAAGSQRLVGEADSDSVANPVPSESSESVESSESTQSVDYNDVPDDFGNHCGADHPRCRCCKTPLIPHRFNAKPSWSVVMSSPYRPKWYHRC